MRTQLRDAVVVVDVLDDFSHPAGGRLLACFEERLPLMTALLGKARSAAVPVIYVNDNRGIWDGERASLVKGAIEGKGSDVVSKLQPQAEDHFLIKPRYSAFDLTPLTYLLESLETERLILMGASTEMCVAQTAIDARELNLKVTVAADACASPDPNLERVALIYLREVTGSVVQTQAGWEPRVQ